MAARKRPPRSPIEQDQRRPQIERAIAMGTSLTDISRRFGFSVSSLSRYRERMPPQLKAAICAAVLKPKEADLDRLKTEESEGILGNLANQRARLLLVQDQVLEDSGEPREVAYIARVIHENIELTGKYLGLFAQHHVMNTTNVNLLVSEDYLRVRQALTTALRPFPEARLAVMATLRQLEEDVASKMLEASGKTPAPAVAAGPIIEHQNSGSDDGLRQTVDVETEQMRGFHG